MRFKVGYATRGFTACVDCRAGDFAVARGNRAFEALLLRLTPLEGAVEGCPCRSTYLVGSSVPAGRRPRAQQYLLPPARERYAAGGPARGPTGGPAGGPACFAPGMRTNSLRPRNFDATEGASVSGGPI